MDERPSPKEEAMRAHFAYSVVLLGTFGVLGTSAFARSSVRPLLDAIREVESGGRTGEIIGDEGRSLGPYQIQRPYWQDSGVPGRYGDVRSIPYAEKVMLAYWQRYCPDALARGDYATLARIHNGGPRGHRNPATLRYWRKVSTALKSR